MKRRHIVTSLVATGLLAAGSMASTNAGAGTVQKAARASAVVGHSLTKSQQSAALRYWTPTRMKAAKNLDIVTAKKSPTTTTDLDSPHGTPHAIAGRNPDGTAQASAIPAAGVEPAAFSYPFPFTRFTVNPYRLTKKSPRVVNGKVFFVQNGGNYVCSGTSVVAPTSTRVWTAGHCVSDGAGHFDTSITFVPAYNGNAATVNPKGTWVGTTMTTTSAWHNTGDFSRDMGAFNVALLSGYTLTAKVGAAGFAWNQNADQQFVDFGYPQASPFNGTSMTVCIAASAVRDTGIGGAGPAPIGIGCDMTGGSSGGSWNIGWTESSPGFINGHNDYKYTTSQPLAMYSPYFDTLANTVRCQGQGTGSGC